MRVCKTQDTRRLGLRLPYVVSKRSFHYLNSDWLPYYLFIADDPCCNQSFMLGRDFQLSVSPFPLFSVSSAANAA